MAPFISDIQIVFNIYIYIYVIINIEYDHHPQIRWEESVDQIDDKLNNLIGNVMVSAACTSYLGPFTTKYRQSLIAEWIAMCREKEVPIDEGYEFIANSIDANQVRRGIGRGIPSVWATGLGG